LKDPIQVHLLTETALSDSKGYEILSQEEVDELKKQAALLMQRVESTRSNLAIQSKYRDAAASMARLNGPGQNDEQRNRQAERERIECEQKCNELASELLNLEKRLLIPHRKIVEHTAAILQLTHKANRKKAALQSGQLVNGIPGSPESLYTYSHSRNSLDQVGDDTYFDDPSAYQLDGMDRQRKNVIEIPLKSPVREHNQLRVEVDRMREENAHLRSQTDGLLKKLQGLNVSLRDTIIRFNPEVNRDYDEPPRVSSTPDIRVADMLKSQVEYLESGLVAVQAEQDSFTGGSQMGERLEAMNLQLRDLLMISDPHYTPMQLPSDSDVNGQMTHLEDSIRSVDSQLARASSKANDGSGLELTGLWDTMQRGFADAKQRQEDRKRSQIEKGLAEDDVDMSEDEGFDTTEPYSIDSFATRVQWMHSQAITLRDQKYVLKRQIKQQRKLNNLSDEQKDKELSDKQMELEESRQLLSRTEKNAMDVEMKLSEALADLERASDAAASAGTAKLEIEERNAKITELERSLKVARSNLEAAESGTRGSDNKLAEFHTQIEQLSQDKRAADEMARDLGEELAARQKELDEKKDEFDKLESEMVDLKLDLTMAKAELDGAYGSRAERAAEVAAIKESVHMQKLQREFDKLESELKGQVDVLKKELQATAQQLHEVTQQSIQYEIEQDKLEEALKDAQQTKAVLDGQLHNTREKMAKLQEDLDNERLKIHGDGSRPGAGASVLSERFRATMREERKKFQDDIKVGPNHMLDRRANTNNFAGGTPEVPQAGRRAQQVKAQLGAWQKPAESAIRIPRPPASFTLPTYYRHCHVTGTFVC
jgi:DNA repair exonuclease SbcCD ATPase subunit